LSGLNNRSDVFVPNEKKTIVPYQNGKLSNLTFAVKEVYDVKGFVTGSGNAHWKKTHNIALTTAPSVESLLNEGATLIGKTISDEMAFSLDGENQHYGTPLNPACSNCIPGGSSSGSASAVAQGIVDFALGTDTAGSIRVPASYCGIYGFRPTHNRISTSGIHPMAPSFDVVGWFANSIDILSKVGEVLLNTSVIDTDVSELVIPKGMIDQLNPDVRTLFLNYVNSLPFTISEIQLPSDGAEWIEILRNIQWWELNSAHGEWIKKNIDTFGEEIKGRLEKISSIKRVNYDENIVKQQELIHDLNNILINNRLIIFPTVHDIAPVKGRSISDARACRAKAMRHTCYATVAGLPQITMPLLKHNNCPIGISLLSAQGNDELILGAASIFARNKWSQ